MTRYSASARGFFPPEITYPELPTDLIEITPEYHAQLMAAQAAGATIEPDNNGVPQAVFPAVPTPEETLAAWRATAEVSRFQAFAALYGIGQLDAARAAVDAAGGLAVIAWENAQVFRRNSPMILQLAPALGLTDEDLDALFEAAAQITA